MQRRTWDRASFAVKILSLAALIGPGGCETKMKYYSDKL